MSKDKFSKVLFFIFGGFFALIAGAFLQNLTGVKTANAQTEIALKSAEKKSDFTVYTASEIEQEFAQIPQKPPTNRTIISNQNYNLAVANLIDRDGKPEHHKNSDRLFFIKTGTAKMRIGGRITDPQETAPGEIRSISGSGYADFREVKIEAGAVLSIPRDVPYQMLAKGSAVTFVVVRMN